MNFSLTKQELVMLLRLANIGDWVMFAGLDDEDADPGAVEHKKVMQKLFAAAHKAQMDDVVFYDAQSGEYYETSAFENDCQGFIGQFGVNQLREVLADQLAVRDLIEQAGEEAFENMNRMERGGKLQQLAFRYEDEFEKHGLERLQILNTSGRGNA